MTEPGMSLIDRAEIAAKVEDIWKFVLNVQTIRPQDDFYGLGGDSLNAVEMAAGVEMVIGVVIDPFEVLERPVLEDFVDLIVLLMSETGPQAGESDPSTQLST